jgi:hypothetical protein
MVNFDVKGSKFHNGLYQTILLVKKLQSCDYYTNNSKIPIRKIPLPSMVATTFLFRDSYLILVNSGNRFLAEITEISCLQCIGIITCGLVL